MKTIGAFESTTTWRKLREVEGDESVSFVIGINQQDNKTLHDTFLRLSDPSHQDYGAYLSKDEVNQLTRPHPDAIHDIKRWLSNNSDCMATSFHPSTNVLLVKGCSALFVNKMLNTTLFEYENNNRKRILRAARKLILPSEIAPWISFCSLSSTPLGHPTSHYAPEKRQLRNNGNLPVVTPAFLRQLYSIPKNLSVTNASSTQSVAEFFTECWHSADLTQFLSQVDDNNITHPKVLSLGDRECNSSTHATSESTLDVQYIVAMAPNATTTVWNMAGTNPFSDIDEPFLEWAGSVLDDENPPLVHSMSYSDDEQHIFSTSSDYARSFDLLLQKMAVRGLSVLFASGDDGVSGLRHRQFDASEEEACSKSGPQWPSSSPYATSVGATQHWSGDLRDPTSSYFNNNMEMVCAANQGGRITSGSGFSTIYPRPAYQIKTAAIDKYVASANCPESTNEYFNPNGRAYPDIAVYGTHLRTISNARRHSVSGTSASTPILAAMVTLWNDRRLNAGKPPLGFLNPLLYEIGNRYPEAFNDVVTGNNGDSNTGDYTCPLSFRAGPHWDGVSGFGTPKFDVMSNLTFNAETLLQENSKGENVEKSSSDASVPWLFLSLGWIIILLISLIMMLRYMREKYRSYQVVLSSEEEKASEDTESNDEVAV